MCIFHFRFLRNLTLVLQMEGGSERHQIVLLSTFGQDERLCVDFQTDEVKPRCIGETDILFWVEEKSSNALLLRAKGLNIDHRKRSRSLSLVIVSRYSTVVVLVVEVVVVVLEVVSASSQQRPVGRSVQLWLINTSRFFPTDSVTDRRCLTVPLWAAEVRFVLIMRLFDIKK